MKVLFLARDLGYGGAERQLVILAKGLQEQGHSASVAVFYPGGALEKSLLHSGVQVHSLDKKGRWDLFFFFFRLLKFSKQERPDIIHGYLTPPNLLAIALKPMCSRIRVVWGVRGSNLKFEHYDWLARLLFYVECGLSRLADLIIVNSRAGLDYCAEHRFPKKKMVMIPNGIDTERFKPCSEMRRKVRAEWGLTEDVKVIGLIGRLAPMKDHQTFLRAAAMISEARKDVHFICVGNGPPRYRRELFGLCEDLGLSEYLSFIDVCDDMPAIYNALDIVVSSSAYGEGFSNVIGEAMACNISCVVTEVGDSSRIVGEQDHVVPAANPHALKTTIEKLLDNIDSDANRGEKIRQRIVDHFPIQKLILATETAFLKILK